MYYIYERERERESTQLFGISKYIHIFSLFSFFSTSLTLFALQATGTITRLTPLLYRVQTLVIEISCFVTLINVIVSQFSFNRAQR